MPVIDAQAHCYGRKRPDCPWNDPLPGPLEMTGEDMVKAVIADWTAMTGTVGVARRRCRPTNA